jgi:glucose/arabinose dehydrogenase
VAAVATEDEAHSRVEICDILPAMANSMGRVAGGSIVVLMAIVGATIAGQAQQPTAATPAAGGRGQGQQQGARGGGRAPRPECVNPKIPAAECNVGATPIQWADPVLGDGPFVVQSAVPAHRNLRVVVMAKFQQPWSIAFLPDGNIFVTERPGRLRIIRCSASTRAGSAGTDGRRAPSALRREQVGVHRLSQAGTDPGRAAECERDASHGR